MPSPRHEQLKVCVCAGVARGMTAAAPLPYDERTCATQPAVYSAERSHSSLLVTVDADMLWSRRKTLQCSSFAVQAAQGTPHLDGGVHDGVGGWVPGPTRNSFGINKMSDRT